MTRPTLRDIAREAQLSVTQASRALNDHDDVAPTTKELVRRVAAELNYVPNLEARRLQDPLHGSGTIGIILGSESLRFSDPYFGNLLSAMVVEADKHGLQLQLSTPPPDADSTAPYDQAVRQRRVDGFVLVRTLVDDPRVDFLLERNVPFVTFGRTMNSDRHAVVDAVADSLGPAVVHLVEFGHRRIACLAEPLHFAIAAQRLASFSKAIEDAGAFIGLEEPTILVAGFHEDDGLAATTQLLTAPNPPTAIVALNDLLALGALRAAENLGLHVPGELSVVGFDDIGAAGLVRPGLTTMRQPAEDVGAMLVDELVPMLETRSPAKSERLVTPSLVVRGSTGPARN